MSGGYWYPPDDHQYTEPTSMGSASSVSSDKPEEKRAKAVRRVAEEVTGKKFPVKPKPPMRFI